MSRYYRSFLEESGAVYTARTTAFATATGITDTTILGALNTFDLGLISNSLDTKMKAVYPFVGGTATTQKYNFMDARDLDVAFRLQFFGGGTFSNNGYQPNGTNAYANTFLIANSLSQNSVHLSYYSRTNNDLLCFEIGSESNTSSLCWISRLTDTGYVYANTTTGDTVYPNTNSNGLYMLDRTSSSVNKLFRNGNIIVNGTKTSVTPNPYAIYIGALNSSNTPISFSNREGTFASIGDGLSDTEASTLYTLTQAMQTTLGRQV